ncbi:DsrE family protein [Caballeronia sp. 15711]|uniref:DsrE family protein n=1 Tax=Caballeronia sp. 15711 TaxID=3391029 RepID=UPI0039E327E5
MTQAKFAPGSPVIEEFGQAHWIDGAVHLPDANATYRIVFSVSAPGKKPEAPNAGLERVARAVNLYRMSGVTPDRLHCVAVIHGEATSSVLNDSPYQAAHSRPNPNERLIGALQAAGVEISVCAQALIANGFPQDALLPGVTRSLSALTTITLLQKDGYSLMPL